jgi:hypothetical protein
VFTRHLVGDGAHLTCDIIEQDQKIVFEIGVHRPPQKVLPPSGNTWRLLRAVLRRLGLRPGATHVLKPDAFDLLHPVVIVDRCPGHQAFQPEAWFVTLIT